jgi:hypothetical protein
MVMNSDRASARWDRKVAYFLAAILLAYLVGAFSYIDLPGLYMDAVLPDYLSARTVNPEIDNPVWAIPSATIPLIGGPYHGVQTYYLTTLVSSVFGFNIFSLRLGYAIWGGLALLALHFVQRSHGHHLTLSLLIVGFAATDITLITSLRTQYFIQISGLPFLFLALAFGDYARLSPSRRLILSGFFLGFATYCYFVYFFFLPGLLLRIILQPGQPAKVRQIVFFLAGFCAGLSLYVAGFISLCIELGSLGAGYEWIKNYTTVIGAFSEIPTSNSYLSSLGHALKQAFLSVTNQAQEVMILWKHAVTVSREIKITVILLICGLYSSLLIANAVNKDWMNFAKLGALAVVPVLYLASAAVFGTRLGPHHFIPLLGMIYFLFSQSIHELHRSTANFRGVSIVVTSLLALLITANLFSQRQFFEQVRDSGGAGMYTSAINSISEEALHSTETLFVFPEWGFFMPFAYLTANKVPYELTISQATLARARSLDLRYFRVYFWERPALEEHRRALNELGLIDNGIQTIHSRNGVPAMFYIEAQI